MKLISEILYYILRWYDIGSKVGVGGRSADKTSDSYQYFFHKEIKMIGLIP